MTNRKGVLVAELHDEVPRLPCDPASVRIGSARVSHQALSKRLRRARPRPAQQRQPQRAAGPRQLSRPSAAAAVAAISPSRRGLADGLVRLRRGNQARWVDPLAESARYEQLLAEGFTAQTTRA